MALDRPDSEPQDSHDSRSEELDQHSDHSPEVVPVGDQPDNEAHDLAETSPAEDEAKLVAALARQNRAHVADNAVDQESQHEFGSDEQLVSADSRDEPMPLPESGSLTDSSSSVGDSDTVSVTGSADLQQTQSANEVAVGDEGVIDARTEPAMHEIDVDGSNDDHPIAEPFSTRTVENMSAEVRGDRFETDSERASTASERDQREGETDTGQWRERRDQTPSDLSFEAVKASRAESVDERSAMRSASADSDKPSASDAREDQLEGSQASKVEPPLLTVQELPKPPDEIVEDDEKKRPSEKFRKVADENIDSMVSRVKSGGDIVRDILNPPPPSSGRPETRASSGPYLNETPHAAPDIGGIASASLAAAIFVNELLGRAMEKARKRDKE